MAEYPKTMQLAYLPNETVSVERFGAIENSNDDSFRAALQAIIDQSGQPENTANPNTVKIKIPSGTWYLSGPVYIDAVDGLEIVADNIFGTTIKIPATFTAGAGTVPGTFPSDGLDYATASCFVFARRRHSGKSGSFLVPGAAAAAGAAWWYKFSGLYVDLSAYSTGKSADLIRAPEIANLVLEDIVINGGRHVVHTDDALGMYASTFRNVKMFYGSQFLKAERGTTLLLDQCASVHCDFGFKSGVAYSVYNACSVDHWASGNWAWDLSGTGTVLNGCGCEYGYGGIFRAQDADTEIVVNGGFFLGGALTGDSNYTGQTNEAGFGMTTNRMIYIDKAKVSFNRCFFRNIINTTHMKGTVDNGGRVTFDGNAGEDNANYMQPHEWLQTGNGVGGAGIHGSRIDWTGEKPQFALYTTGDITLTRNGTPQVTFASYDKLYDLGPSYFTTVYGVYPRTGTVTEYRVPAAGIYEFTFNAFIDAIDPGDYIYFNITGQTNRVMVLSDYPDDTNIGNQITLTGRYKLNAGDIVKILYRSFSSTVDPVVKTGARFVGGMV